MREFLKDVWMHGGEESRAITPENITGEKGRAAMSASHLGVGRKGSCCVPLESGETITLADIEGPGIIRHIWMTVPDKTAAGSFVMRDLVLRFYWDDEETPSVECPVGDFFCNGFGERAIVNSMPICVNPTGGMNCYFEMPFRKHAKVTLTSEHPGFIKYIFYTFNYALTDVPDDAMYFHARFNRERSTRRGVDYTVLDGVRGKGYYVGTYMALCALERYWWGEGEMKFFLERVCIETFHIIINVIHGFLCLCGKLRAFLLNITVKDSCNPARILFHIQVSPVSIITLSEITGLKDQLLCLCLLSRCQQMIQFRLHMCRC